MEKTGLFFIGILLLFSLVSPGYSQTEISRPGYVYDNGDIISSEQEQKLDSFLRKLDRTTSIEIVILTLDSFYGHGIKKNGQEINDRDALAHYVFNEVSLEGIKGIGKAGKDNGLLILFSKERDSSGGSMRIEVGRGLEGQITDGTAGQILDMYLVPARDSYLRNNDTTGFDNAFMDTVLILAQKLGYSEDDAIPNHNFAQPEESELEKIIPLLPLIILFIVFFVLAQKKRKGRSFGFIGGGFGGGSGGGFGGGGGGSGGGGAGR